MNAFRPLLSVVIPTHDNQNVLRRCLESWQAGAAGKPVELVVIEDGCRDLTPQYLEELSNSAWGRQHLRWIHEADLHELRCTNRGLQAARADLVMAWQDDMFLSRAWLVDELIETFAAYSDLGLLCLSRGLNCLPFDGPIEAWEDLLDDRRLQSTIGPAPLNWFRLEEVDAVIRPWAVRRACLETVGYLDEAFVPTEWDEADLCFRIRRAGWKIAAHGYERVGAYAHLGSSTLSKGWSDQYQQRVLENGRLFHRRWDDAIRSGAGRERHRWWRRSSATGWLSTAAQACLAVRRLVSL
jgi:glycosyltransferase involved in cell wall biosynthesis